MKKSNRHDILLLAFTISVLALVVAFATARGADAKPFKKADLIGAWLYVFGRTITSEGETIDQFGEHPAGIFIFMANGWYSHIVMRPNLPKIKKGTLQETAPEEREALVEGVLAHFGTWTADEAEGTLTIKILKSSFPNFDGLIQTRMITILNKDTLEYVNMLSSTGPGAKVVSRLRRLNP